MKTRLFGFAGCIMAAGVLTCGVLVLPAAAQSDYATPYAFSTLAGSPGISGTNDGTGSAARFYYPQGVAADNAGNVYVADTFNFTVRKATPSGTNWVVTTLAGLAGNYGSADGTGTNARFGYVYSVATDSADNVYVADTDNQTIRKVTPAGVVTTLAGLPGYIGSSDGLGTNARFNYPVGLAVDSASNVYVADFDNDTIRQVTPAGMVTTLAGQAGIYGSVDGLGSNALFHNPWGVAVDGANNVYVVDMDNSTIRKMTPAGTNWVVATLAGLAGNYGNRDATGTNAQFYYPQGGAVDSLGNVYVTDSANQTVRKVSPTGVVTTLAGLVGIFGSANGLGSNALFSYPVDVAVDASGTLYVADENNDEIRSGTNPCPQVMTCPSNIVVTSCTNIQEFYTPTGFNTCCGVYSSVVCIPPSGSYFTPGTTTTVNCVATDCNSNINFCSFTVTVISNNCSTNCITLTCPSNIVATTCSNCATVFYAVTATNVCCASNVMLYYSLPSGTCFPLGTNTVQVTAVDPNCASTPPATCTFTVTVQLGSNCCVAPPANMVLWLPFDETHGPTSANLASFGNPGTQINGPPVVFGAYVDNSLSFNGINQYVTVPDYPAIDIGTGNLTIDAWVLRSVNDPNSPPSVIVDKRDGAGIGYSLSISYGELILTLSNNNYRDTNGFVPPDGQWHFVAVVLNQASTPPKIQFYVDTGPTGTAFPPLFNLANPNSFWVAASPLGGNQPWLGDLDEVEVYDRALANSELAGIYNAGVAGKCKPPCTGITVICPTNKTVPCGSNWIFDPPVASTCCTNLIPVTGLLTNLVITPTSLMTNGACSNLITQTWQIIDGCGDTNFCSQTVTVANTNPPYILCPPNIVISSCTNVPVFYAPTATGACGVTNVTVVCTPPSGSSFAPGTTTTVNCVATDCSGITNSCSFIVTVTAQLTVVCPTNKTVFFGSNWTFDLPQASSCCPSNTVNTTTGVVTNLTITPISLVTNGACPRYDVTETWLITDNCGNSTNCSQTVTVLCCVAPPANMVLWLPFDETHGPTSANLASFGNPGTQINGPPVVFGAYVDNSLSFNGINQYVTVPDYPAIDIGTGNLTIDAWVLRSVNDPNSPPSVIVDKRDGAGIGYSLSISYGELILTLSNNNYRDTNGFVPPDGQWHFVAVVLNQASTPPKIQFYVDTGPTGTAFPPLFNLANPNSFWVAASPLGGNQPWLGDLDEVEVYDRALANSELAGIYNAGVAGKCKPPCTGITVICPTNKTVPCGSNWIFDPPVASTCCTNLIPVTGLLTNLVITPTSLMTNGACSNLITQTWQIIDGCGDTNFCSQTVTVANTNPPYILCPPNIVISSCTNVPVFYAPTATGACGVTNVTVVCTPPSGSSFAPGTTTTVNCVATDCSGITNSCSFTVTVTPQLTVICPTNKTVYFGSNWTFDLPQASSCCPSNTITALGTLTNLTITPISIVTNGACPRYDVTETWLITDNCGNSTNCSQTVTVLCCVAPPANMVLWLPFDETNGPATPNLASFANYGTKINNPTVILGAYVDNSLGFNGHQYVTVPDYPAIDIGTGNLTIDAWVLRSVNDPNSPPSVIVDKRNGAGIGYSLSISYGELILTLSNNNYRDTNGLVPADGQWHFVGVILNQSTSTPKIQFYVDTGPTGTAFPPLFNLANTNSFWVAASPLGGNQPWLGDLDEVEVYDRALAVSELAGIYNAGMAGKCKPVCTTGLTVTCPSNQTVQCGSAWMFGEPTASSCCSNVFGVNGALTNVLITPTGTVTNGVCPKLITRTWLILDGCGDSASCSQTMTVVDTTPPTITCPTNTIVVNYNTNCQIVIPLIRPPATDNCTPASQLVYTQTPTNGAVVNGPSQLVTVTVSDLCGNSSQCQVLVIGRYPPPVIICPGVITVTNCIMPNVLPLVSATGCNGGYPFTFTQSPPAGTLLGPGSTTVTVTVTGLGGSDSCVIAVQYSATMSFLNVLTNTGIAANGSLLANAAVDPHYTLGPVPGAVSGYTVPQAVAVTNLWSWLELTPYVSEWIAPCTWVTPNYYLSSCPYGYYTYTNQFVLPVGADPATASISGRWAADDGASAMLFNGAPTGNMIPANYGFTHWTPFTISSNFHAHPAVNTILFVVTNAQAYGDSPTGLRVEYTNAFSTCTNCAPPSVVWMTSSMSLPLGGTAVFTVNVSGTLPFTYQWYHNSTPLSPSPHYPGGVNGPTLTITPVGYADAGAYYVLVSNPCGQLKSPTRTLTVTPGWVSPWGWWTFPVATNYLLATVGPNLVLSGTNTLGIGTGSTLDFGLPNPGGGIANVLDVPPLPANTSIQVPLIAAVAGGSSDTSYTVMMDLYEPDTSLGTPSTLFESDYVTNLGSGGQDGVGLTVDAQNILHGTGSAAGTPFDAASAAPMPVDAWNRVALVVDDPQDGVAVNVDVYLNGQPVASLAVPTPAGLPVNWNNSPPILLSAQPNAGALNGEMYVSSIQFHAAALKSGMIAGMGSPANGPMTADNPAVVMPPVLTVSIQAKVGIILSWSGNAYVLQETTNLSSGQWVDSSLPFTESEVIGPAGGGGIMTTAVVTPAPNAPRKFYRLIFSP